MIWISACLIGALAFFAYNAGRYYRPLDDLDDVCADLPAWREKAASRRKSRRYLYLATACLFVLAILIILGAS